jgi:hypothetical protein
MKSELELAVAVGLELTQVQAAVQMETLLNLYSIQLEAEEEEPGIHNKGESQELLEAEVPSKLQLEMGLSVKATQEQLVFQGLAEAEAVLMPLLRTKTEQQVSHPT